MCDIFLEGALFIAELHQRQHAFVARIDFEDWFCGFVESTGGIEKLLELAVRAVLGRDQTVGAFGQAVGGPATAWMNTTQGRRCSAWRR
ncbi:hypothetical protein IQ26_06599 [Mesorhizobium tianshanense]|uniref:Uncharacterized protein n=1 Tax=Mesorhizobium tianshanense TaxID=39844 RepID=A0A562MS73_9HYPH|nr:hypothetical protein IQ26_06599 [Mesorhizobium tianshanense]